MSESLRLPTLFLKCDAWRRYRQGRLLIKMRCLAAGPARQASFSATLGGGTGKAGERSTGSQNRGVTGVRSDTWCCDRDETPGALSLVTRDVGLTAGKRFLACELYQGLNNLLVYTGELEWRSTSDELRASDQLLSKQFEGCTKLSCTKVATINI